MRIYLNKNNANIYFKEGNLIKAVPISYDEVIDFEKDACDVIPDDLDEWNEKEYLKIEKALKL